jgi:hypothetical protein
MKEAVDGCVQAALLVGCNEIPSALAAPSREQHIAS